MAFSQSLYNQSSILRINTMVVDDDPVSLEFMSRMLERSKYRDPSTEFTVIAVRDAREALFTLKFQRNNIDLIVTEYDMPGMNGLQLKQQITRQFGEFPVIVMSSDINKEQESLACGALCFLPKPIKATNLPQIYQVALNYKRKGKSILRTEHNHKDTTVSILQQIQLLPEQANVSKTKKNKKFSSRSDSRSVNNLNGSCNSTDGSRKNRKRKSNDDSGDNVESMPQPSKKSKISWTDYLQDLFVKAIIHIGYDKAVPKKILEFMDVPYLTRANVASHLQKYRHFLRQVNEGGSTLHGRGMKPYHSNYTASSSWYNISLNNKSSYFKPRYGLGQSRLLSNTSEPVRFNQMPYNYMNRLSTYEPHRIGSNGTMPINSNLSFSTQPLQNERSKSFFEPTVLGNKTGQTSQVLGFGQHGMSAINGNNLNNAVSRYGSSTSTQPGMSSYGSPTSNQPGMSSYGSVYPNQLGMSSQGSLAPNQQGMSSYGILTSNQPGMSKHGSLTPKQRGKIRHASLTPTQPGITSYGSLSPNQLGMSSHGSLTPTQLGMSSYGSLISNQPRMSSHGSLSPNQPGMSSHGSLMTPNEPAMGSHESLSPNQPGMSSHGSLMTPTEPAMGSHESLSPNQPGMISHGSLTPTQPEMSSFGSLTTNQPQMSSYESLTPNQQEPSHFSYELFLNNDNTASKPQPHASATIQPNFEIPQLENLILYDDLSNINEPLCDISIFDFDQEKEQQQEEVVSTSKFDIPTNFETELNQIFSLEEDSGWTFLNINEGHSNEEPSNSFTAPETNDPTLNINPKHAQEQDVPDFDWSFLDLEDSMFTSDMN